MKISSANTTGKNKIKGGKIKMKIIKTNHPNDTYCEDYDELLRLMQIPDIKKIIFHKGMMSFKMSFILTLAH